MSDRRAIGAVTASLTALVKDALGGVLPVTDATNLRPGEAVGALDPPSVNVYLFRAVPSAALRSAAAPTRDARGRVIQRPVAAWELSYLLTFVGKESELEPELLLGATVTALTALPLLQRGFVASVDTALTSELGNRRLAAGSGLDEQVQLVRFTPMDLSMEVMSQLWSSLTSEPYALSTAWQAGVVLMTADLEPAPSLAVGGGAHLTTTLVGRPHLEAVKDSGGPGKPVTISSTLVLTGVHLRGAHTVVRLGELEVLLDAHEGSSGRLEVDLSPDSGSGPVALDLAPGTLGVGVRHLVDVSDDPLTPGLRPGSASNVLPVLLRPVVAAPPTFTDGGDGPSTITVVVQPEPDEAWEYALLLNEHGVQKPRARMLDTWSIREATATEPRAVVFERGDVPAGDWLVRIRVNGADSLLTPDSSGVYAQPLVSLP